MSEKNHPNFHAVKFVTDVTLSMMTSLRNAGRHAQITDEMTDLILIMAETIEQMVDEQTIPMAKNEI